MDKQHPKWSMEGYPGPLAAASPWAGLLTRLGGSPLLESIIYGDQPPQSPHALSRELEDQSMGTSRDVPLGVGVDRINRTKLLEALLEQKRR